MEPGNRLLELRQLIARQLARLSESVDLNDVFGDLARFDTLDLSLKLAALQLVPENADYLIRLEAASHYAAGKALILDGPRVGRTRLHHALTSDAVKQGPLGLNEDPCDNLLTESLTSIGGSYIVFPGIVEGATYILRNLSKALFLHPNPFPDTEFIAHAADAFRSLLAVSDTVARRAGLSRHLEPRRSSQIVIPPSPPFGDLMEAVTFSTEECDALLRPRRLSTTNLAPFMSTAGSVTIAEYSVGNGDLHRRPLVKVGQNLVVSEPGILTATLRHAVIAQAAARGVSGEVASRYREAVWDNVTENLRYLGLHRIPLALPPFADEAPLLEGLFDLDRDKALYVQLVTDPLDGYEAERVFGTWDAGALGAILDIRARDIERWLFTQASPPNEILVLTVLGGVGRQVVLGIGSKAMPLVSLQMAIPAHDLETIALLEGGNPLALLQFARAYHSIRERTEVQSGSILDEFELYRHNGHSYYFSDEKLPNGMWIAPGSAGEARREAVRQRDPHGVRSFGEGVIEVTCLYGPDVPIYVPFSLEFERMAILVENLPIPVWVVGPRRDDVPLQLRAIYWDLAETTAYWLWQCTPFLQLLLEREGQSRHRLSVHIQLREDGDWTRPNQGTPPPFRECVRAALDGAAGALSLEFAASVVAHFGGSDNRGERQLVRLLLESLSQLLSEPVDKSGIDQAVETYAPLGLKKKLLVLDLGQNPLLDPEDLPQYRKVQEFQTDRISDEIAAFLKTPGKSPGVVPKSERVQVVNDVVAHVHQRLMRSVKTVRGGELLPWLVHQHEGLTRRMFDQRLALPTREACFGQNGNTAKEVARELVELYTASTGVRFLIELVAAQPPNGIRPMSVELFDELAALASSIINWGFESDYIKFGILDLELSILQSGRLGAPREHFKSARDTFMELHAAGQLGRARGWFPHHWRPNETGEPSDSSGHGLMDQLDSAFGKETGFSLSEWMAAYGELWNVGSEQTGSVKTLALNHIVQRLSASLGWEQGRASELLAQFTLSPRVSFLDPPPPFERRDVYPWRFGRPLSYMRRPLVVLPAKQSSNPNVAWGNRHLLHSAQYLADRLMTGRYEATSQELNKLKGNLNHRRGDSFNEKVAAVFKRFPNTVVKPKVRKIKGMRLDAYGGLGDIDVLVADPKRHRVLVVECSDLAVGRTPHELANELKALFKEQGTDRSKVEKLVDRTQWVRDHLADVLEELGIIETEVTKRWKVEPLVVVDEEVFSPHLYPSPVPVLSLRQLEVRGCLV